MEQKMQNEYSSNKILSYILYMFQTIRRFIIDRYVDFFLMYQDT
jgi:hypothetical protein